MTIFSHVRKVFAVSTLFVVAFGGFFVQSAQAVGSIALTSPLGGERWNGSHAITWTATGTLGETVSILYSTNDFITSAEVVAAVPFDAGSHVWNTALVPYGTNYKIRVQAVGFATSGTFTIDNTPPISTINNGTDPGPVQTDTINVTVNDVTSGVSTTEYGFSPDSTCNASDTFGNPFTSAVDFSIAGDHTDYLCIKATDLASNIGYQLVGQLNTDNTVPVISPANIIGTTVQGGNDTIVITFDGPVIAGDGDFTDGDELSAVESPNGTPLNLTGAIFAYFGNTLTITLSEPTEFLKNGDVVAVTPAMNAIRDAANNFVANTEVVGTTAVTGDVTGPTVALTYSPDRPVRDADTVTITATFNETLDSTPQIAIDTQGVDVGLTPMTGSGLVWTYSWDVPAGSDGIATVAISAFDLAGNANSLATNETRTVDNTAPSITSYTLNGNASTVAFNPALGSVTIVMNANEDVKFNRTKILNSGGVEVKFFTDSVTFHLSSTEVWDGTGSTGDGIYQVKPKIVDQAGNETDVVLAPYNIVIDTLNPTITAFTAPNDDVVYRADAGDIPLQFTPDGTVTATVCSYAIDNGSSNFIPCTSGVEVDTTVGGLADGRHSIVVTVVDEAGNSFSQPAISFVFDNDNTLTVDDTPANNPDFPTIQAAVNAATTGDTISVAAGTYNESPNITKSVTLQSVGGRDVTTITLQSGPTYLGSLTVGASNVTISGFTILGFDGGAGLASTNILLNAGIDNISITNNRIKVGQIGPGSNGDDGLGLVTTYTENPALFVGNLSVSSNIFEPVDPVAGGSRAFFINTGVNNFTFSDNAITGKFTRGSYTQAKNGLVENNIITGVGAAGSRSSGIGTWGYPDPTVWGHTAFSGNTISGVQRGINIIDTNNVTVSGNNLSGNGTGIWVKHSVEGFAASFDPATISISNNNLSNEDDFGIELFGSFSIDINATQNWWGDASGPAHSLNPGGVGASVSDDVDYSPWCTNIGCTEFGSNDSLDHYEIIASPADSVTTPGPITLMITAKDIDGITRVNDNGQITLTANRPVSFTPDYILNLENGVKNVDVSYSGVGDVNVHVTRGSVTSIKVITFTALPDTSDYTAPPAPVITVAPAIVNADFYTINGTADADLPVDSSRTVRLFNGSILAGTTILNVGQTAWSIVVSLNQEADNTFTATSTDVASNLSGVSNAVTITEATSDTSAPVVTSFMVSGITDSGAVLAVTTNENATCRYAATDLAYETMTVMGGAGTIAHLTVLSGLTPSTTYSYYARCQDAFGNTMSVFPSLAVFTTLATAVPPPTGHSITWEAKNNFAQPDGTFLNGWHYAFKVTVYDEAETNLSVKFSDWVNSADSSVVPASPNMRLLINQAGGMIAGVGSEALIENGSGDIKSYSLGNAYTDQNLDNVATPIDISGIDLDTSAVGRQIQFDVFTKVPIGTASGFYTTNYIILTN